MQKLPFEIIVKAVSVPKEQLAQLLVRLKTQHKTFSRWVREQMERELSQPPKIEK
jgi:hypothetical protein